MTINNELKLNNADMNAFGGSRTQTHAAPQQFLEASNRARQRLPRPRPYDSEVGCSSDRDDPFLPGDQFTAETRLSGTRPLLAMAKASRPRRYTCQRWRVAKRPGMG
jgi:hypothetical protein